LIFYMAADPMNFPCQHHDPFANVILMTSGELARTDVFDCVRGPGTRIFLMTFSSHPLHSVATHVRI